jgi:hypothetical protein
MKRTALQAILSSLAVVGAALAVFLLVHGTGAQETGQRIPMISDWSHRHVVFSQPHSFEEAWRLQREPRYWIQILRRNARRHGRMDHESESDGENFSDFERRRREHKPTFERDWGQSLGMGGSTSSPVVPVYPAKFSFDINATPSCANDYVVFPTNLAGVTGGQASIIAYNELYNAGTGTPTAFCNVPNPSVYWSYNTNFDSSGVATTGTVDTSPVLSLDGSKVAFVETTTNGPILHLLKWHAGDGGAINTAAAPNLATVWTADGLAGHCPVTGACMISIGLTIVVPSGNKADTASSPFYDYQRDVIYVGDDQGVLHKIMNAFGVSGTTPSELTSMASKWPITVGSSKTTRLTSPTLDSVSGNIFVADSNGVLSYVRETFSRGTGCSTPCVGGSIAISSGTHVITDGPVVDSVTGKVFVFIGNNGATTPVAAVVQSDTTLSASVSASLGTGVGQHIHAGTFDNAYLTGDGSAGRLYVCGSSNDVSSTPTIQRIGFTNTGSTFPTNPIGTMNAVVDGVTLPVASGGAECSPVTELFNTNAPTASQDQIFFGVRTRGNPTNCFGGGCVMSINVTGIPGTLTIANSIAEIGGPSGIIVDNDANTTTFPQSSSLYFSTQANGTCNAIPTVGCAVKVTQAGLN